ncbi:hypothetical protein [Lacticaseibacillus jixiensis]|uniref:hypothetical protein n=1 Tax=Lacticaseibacillus jixiensis TaxID=3231926 RepID=UPI0036F25897
MSLSRRNLFLDDEDYGKLKAEAKKRKTSLGIYVRFVLACVLHDDAVKQLVADRWQQYDVWRKDQPHRSNAADFYRIEGDRNGKAQNS